MPGFSKRNVEWVAAMHVIVVMQSAISGELKSWKFPSIKVKHDNGFRASGPQDYGDHINPPPCTIILANRIKLRVRG